METEKIGRETVNNQQALKEILPRSFPENINYVAFFLHSCWKLLPSQLNKKNQHIQRWLSPTSLPTFPLKRTISYSFYHQQCFKFNEIIVPMFEIVRRSRCMANLRYSRIAPKIRKQRLMERSFHRILVKHVIADKETFNEAPFFHEGVFFAFSVRSRARIMSSSWEKRRRD